MASNNNDTQGNGGKRSKNSVSGNLSPGNATVKRKRKVGPVGPSGLATAKTVTASTSGVGSEKSSKHIKGSKVKSLCGKSRRGSGKNSVGTLDQTIRERNIFTAVAKMPEEIQTMLIKNGWIGKITVDDNCFGRSGE